MASKQLVFQSLSGDRKVVEMKSRPSQVRFWVAATGLPSRGAIVVASARSDIRVGWVLVEICGVDVTNKPFNRVMHLLDEQVEGLEDIGDEVNFDGELFLQTTQAEMPKAELVSLVQQELAWQVKFETSKSAFVDEAIADGVHMDFLEMSARVGKMMKEAPFTKRANPVAMLALLQKTARDPEVQQAVAQSPIGAMAAQQDPSGAVVDLDTFVEVTQTTIESITMATALTVCDDTFLDFDLATLWHTVGLMSDCVVRQKFNLTRDDVKVAAVVHADALEHHLGYLHLKRKLIPMMQDLQFSPVGFKFKHMTKKAVVAILEEMHDQQRRLDDAKRALVDTMVKNETTDFLSCYEGLVDVVPEEPHDSWGVPEWLFPTVLEVYKDDPEVTKARLDAATFDDSAEVAQMPLEKIVEVYRFIKDAVPRMCSQLKTKAQEGLNMHVVHAAIDTAVDCELMRQFGLRAKELVLAEYALGEDAQSDAKLSDIKKEFSESLVQALMRFSEGKHE